MEPGIPGDPDDDPGGVEVVVQRPPLPEELGGEDDVMDIVLPAEPLGESYRYGGFDDYDSFGAYGLQLPDD